jgi:hypothetical protein
MSYETELEAAMSKRLAVEPELATTIAQVLRKLNAKKPYEPALVDAIFQKWDRWPITFTDAYAFILVYADIMRGRTRIARISLGETPGNDRATEENNAKLEQLSPQFYANFQGGNDDHDGNFGWYDHIHLGGSIVKTKQLVPGPIITVGPRLVPLEVGYQSAAKTMVMLKSGGVARWPYHSSDIWVLYRPNMPSIETTCQQDDNGWPCSRTRINSKKIGMR